MNFLAVFFAVLVTLGAILSTAIANDYHHKGPLEIAHKWTKKGYGKGGYGGGKKMSGHSKRYQHMKHGMLLILKNDIFLLTWLQLQAKDITRHPLFSIILCLSFIYWSFRFLAERKGPGANCFSPLSAQLLSTSRTLPFQSNDYTISSFGAFLFLVFITKLFHNLIKIYL